MEQQVKKITLRKANQEDAGFLFALRNNPDVYRWFSNPDPVQWEDHLSWLSYVLSGKIKKHLYILESEGERAGQFRLDEVSDTKAIISISLSKEFRGKGLGALGLKEGIKLAKQLGFQELVAEIHQDNLASIKLFQKLGFVFESQKDVWQTFILEI
ncbi:GNAT family N-acetyltransferase [Candidatus Parcubacteria bacterium]|nr:GNAT family N-acetyltransferase [Candidatus Parcubacteria bacterium]